MTIQADEGDRRPPPTDKPTASRGAPKKRRPFDKLRVKEEWAQGDKSGTADGAALQVMKASNPRVTRGADEGVCRPQKTHGKP